MNCTLTAKRSPPTASPTNTRKATGKRCPKTNCWTKSEDNERSSRNSRTSPWTPSKASDYHSSNSLVNEKLSKKLWEVFFYEFLRVFGFRVILPLVEVRWRYTVYRVLVQEGMMYLVCVYKIYGYKKG